ncbi:hypothetical protein PM082_023841 [Marasmius tenuissimus]|nr:hypothetical protein PM082_023841 [Marasmius tenuissimus]
MTQPSKQDKAKVPVYDISDLESNNDGPKASSNGVPLKTPAKGLGTKAKAVCVTRLACEKHWVI